MKRVWILRLITLSVLWVGLGVLTLDGKTNEQILWQAGVFSLLLLIGATVEKLVAYRGDQYLLPTVQLILVIGLVVLTRIRPAAALKQFWWACLGLFVFYLILYALRDYRALGHYRYLAGLGAVVLLFITLLFGVAQGGATSWLKFGNLNFESEELVKVAMLIFLASYLSEYEEILRIGTVQIGRFSLPDWRTLGPFLAMGGFSLLLLAAQKSLGTALVFFSLYVLVLYVVTERWIYLGVAIPVFLCTGTLGYFLFGHVQVRIATWINPWLDASGGGYQIAQSLFAIGGGKIIGTGLGNGIGASQVPAASTDFIFAIIAEELGFAGAMAVLMLFLIVVLRAFHISMKATDRFGQILAAGIGILVGTEAIIILAGVTKLLPLTGIPLPWVSYGGSSLLIHFLLLGILANISHAEAAGPMHSKHKGREYAA
ncbi:bacterial cell division membrane protein [Desulfitobacterium dichloroeliminans LMG P-21439]|uniref:Bacterial cell division membrane protein n=1 Tax=Desulfitobacterium dichloroeliminans (strain LMG P-21439 / DCA1) TaxID=871963 RepID=L0FAB0_DESDL|nr:FtsW/RodA/SpoVE family cell cycle protein [Desulfitobacterium dichloroeliminans]AGA70147.1 bacterial cell division membrane protein [Desulfitobacterium dichloroeliminans LMG P-21439]